MEYIVGAITIVNNIDYNDPNKQNKTDVLGGCVFALSGLKLYADSVIGVSAVGDDFLSLYGEHFERNGLSVAGMFYALPTTHHTVLTYGESGQWTEVPLQGENYFAEQLKNYMIRAKNIVPFCDDNTKGIFLDCGATEDIFGQVDELRAAAPNAKIFWEIPTFSSTDLSIRELVENNIRLFDWYSMNLHEAGVFFGAEGEQNIIDAVADFGVPCFLRAGKKGAYLIDERGVAFAESIDMGPVVDTTGCGNTSSAAALFGICEGYSPRQTVLLANIAAGYNAMQQGPIPQLTPEMRERAIETMQARE